MQTRLTYLTMWTALCGGMAMCGQALALEPYQTVRSMQLIQDRIADGDHAAMPLQSRVLALADQSLREADPELFDDDRNFEALLVYGMSGGNPATFDMVLARLKLKDDRLLIGKGVSQYLRGDLAGATSAFSKFDPLTTPVGSRPLLLLIKGSILIRETPKEALRFFDLARIEAPGTLIEEAALRRSIPATVGTQDADAFLSICSQYARRFLRSPYATQFADELVRGIIEFYGSVDLKRVEAVIDEMTPSHRKVVYLRLARTSAIDGLRDLSDFAAAKAATYGGAPGQENDARAQLYANLTLVTSEDAASVLKTLKGINRDQLNAADKQLLDAAISVAATVIKPMPAAEAPKPAKAEAKTAEPAIAKATDAATPATKANARPQPADSTQTPQQAPAMVEPSAAAPQQAGQAATLPGKDEVDDAPIGIVSETRSKLSEIDKLLSEDQ